MQQHRTYNRRLIGANRRTGLAQQGAKMLRNLAINTGCEHAGRVIRKELVQIRSLLQAAPRGVSKGLEPRHISLRNRVNLDLKLGHLLILRPQA
jgi:hypothetical protein